LQANQWSARISKQLLILHEFKHNPFVLPPEEAADEEKSEFLKRQAESPSGKP
jgi:hypothetical protein